MGLVRRDEHDATWADDATVGAVEERRLAFQDEEELGVRVFVQPRTAARLRVDEDDGGRDPAVVVTDELAREVALRQVGLVEEPDAHRQPASAAESSAAS